MVLSCDTKCLWTKVHLFFNLGLNMLGVGILYLCVVSVSFTSNGGLVEGQVELKSSYNGSTRTVKLGSSFDFSWNYTGDLNKIEWGTKDKDLIASDVLLFILARGGRRTPNISQYNGRRFAHWNQQSPGQVIFTLNPIEEVDNQVFIFRFIPVNNLAADVYDIVQLIVKGPPVVEIVSPAQFTLRGVTASFTCYAKGFPLPDIVWMKQNGLVENEISASSVNVQIKLLNGSSQLIVQNTSTADSGYYICKASNYVSDIARAFLGVVDPASKEDSGVCRSSFNATKGESVLMCCPVKGSPPPQVSWELPNGTLLETGSTILRVTVETENDFGRYRCIARSLEKNVLTANITIRKRVSEPDINDTKISLTDDVEFLWDEVPGASEYLLRLPETTSFWEYSLLGNGSKTSVEIPYNSLPFKSATEKSKRRPLEVDIEVWAYGDSKIIGNGKRYTNVGSHCIANFERRNAPIIINAEPRFVVRYSYNPVVTSTIEKFARVQQLLLFP